MYEKLINNLNKYNSDIVICGYYSEYKYFKKKVLSTDKRTIYENNEIRKCRDYNLKIQNGDYSCINEALKYTNQKYAELCFTDADLIIAKDVSQSTSIDNNIIQSTLGNLECINDLLIAKVIKEIIKK